MFQKGKIYFPKKDSHNGWYSRSYLPHFDGVGKSQAVCYRIFDSMPLEVLEQWRGEMSYLPNDEYEVERRKRIEAYLDKGYGSCFLREPAIAGVVQNNLLYFDGERYRLHAWCVMPNHVHVLFTALPEWAMSKIVGSWKSYTAHEANKIMRRSGKFWQPELFDRYIRDGKHFRNAIAYIENNPVKAGLCAKPEEWCWGSARERVECINQ